MSVDNDSSRVELLAPAGKWDVLEAVIAAGASAVYLGGKKYNMRLHRKDFNFTDVELRSAVAYAHERGVRLYVTVNNLLTDAEIDDLPGYLRFLEDIAADGIIVQDLGVAQLARQLGIRTPLHASVMMNVHNLEGLQLLQELGISRAILGREVTLADIKLWHSQSDMELEYFTHGDMCFSQSSQCYLGGMLFGESSNRGRCVKPCRWPFELIDRESGKVLAPAPAPGVSPPEAPSNIAGPYLLAIKDICLLPFLPEVIDAGVCSLKIEGRMREAGFLADLIGYYRRALDRYYTDPSGYRFDWDEFREFEQKRVRDLSPIYAFGNPGASSVGYTGRREPRFFSSAVREPEIGPGDIMANPLPCPAPRAHDETRPLLAVRAGGLEPALAALEHGADLIYTSGESFLSQDRAWRLDDLAALLAAAHSHACLVVAGTPRITMPSEMGRVNGFLTAISRLQPQPDGIMVTNLGTLSAARAAGLPLYADYSCNIANARAAALLQSFGAVQATAPLEFRAEEVLGMPRRSPLALEAVIHGQLPGMVSDHCLPAALLDGATRFQICSGACRRLRFGLRDAAGMVHPLEIDASCRNHLFMAHELALLPYLRSFYGAGFRSLRLEIPCYGAGEAGAVTALYRANIDRLWSEPDAYTFTAADWERLLRAREETFGAGPYLRGVLVRD